MLDSYDTVLGLGLLLLFLVSAVADPTSFDEGKKYIYEYKGQYDPKRSHNIEHRNIHCCILQF